MLNRLTGGWYLLLTALWVSSAFSSETVSIPTGNTSSSGGTSGGVGYKSDGSIEATWFTATSADTTSGAEVDIITGTPPAAAANRIRFIGKTVGGVEVPAFVDDLGVRKALVSGTGNSLSGPSYWAISSGADAGCAAVGDADLTPACGQEVCSNAGLTCADVIEYSTLLVPTDSTCTVEQANLAKMWVMCK